MFRPELVEADADDDEATEDISIYRRQEDDDEVSKCLSVQAKILFEFTTAFFTFLIGMNLFKKQKTFSLILKSCL